MLNNKKIYQIMASLLVWSCVPIAIGVLSLARGGSPTAPFPKEEFLKFVEPNQLCLFLVAGFLFFMVMAFIRHKSKKEEEQKRAFFFADLVLSEMGSALYSFGSILMVSVFLGATFWYILAALLCYGLGSYLKPSE